MLKILSSIKHKGRTFAALTGPALLLMIPSPRASAEVSRLDLTSGQDKEKQSLNFFASARLHSPDRNFETATPVVKVNLDGTQTVVIKGSAFKVTLETEPSGFSNAQLVKVSAAGHAGQAGERTSFTAGTFKITDAGGHNFLFREKSRGWLLEVRLKPVGVRKPQNQSPAPSLRRSPTRYVEPKRPKRLPA
jgi:hypothetical protein